jgi:hypothetical protein
MRRTVLPVLIAVICILRAISQVVGFVQNPDMLETTPLLVFGGTVLIVALQVVAAYLALKKPFLAFLTLVGVVGTHAVFFPLGVAISSETVLGPNFWVGFMITSLVHILVALLAYASWRVARSANKASGVLERA